MQYFETISFSTQTIDAILGETNDRVDLIVNELQRQIVGITSLLTSYHWHEKGVVEAVKIVNDTIQIGKIGKGSFAVNYAINIHYGCSDIDIDLDQKMTIGIAINLQSGEVVLAGEYIPEREPDGY